MKPWPTVEMGPCIRWSEIHGWEARSQGISSRDINLGFQQYPGLGARRRTIPRKVQIELDMWIADVVCKICNRKKCTGSLFELFPYLVSDNQTRTGG